MAKINQKQNKPSKLYFKINKFLLFIFILFLPTQLGKHFFFSGSYLSGVRVDYLAPTLYLTDILAFIIFILNFKTVGKFFRQKKILLILVFLAVNVLFSQSKIISVYWYLKILELLAIYAIYLKKLISEKLILLGFLSAGTFELILSLLQFINKHSLQGVFYFFGERFFSLNTPGIAKASFNGTEILRAYGTFSHPNSLAGFFLLVYFFILASKKFNKFSLLKYVSLFVFSCLIFISFSKVAIATYIILTSVFLLKVKSKSCRLCFFSRIFVILILGLIFFQVKSDPTSLGKRLELINSGVKIIGQFAFFGVGLGNYLLAQSHFVSKYSLFFNQPVHNIFLLFYAETGLIIGTVILFLLIKKISGYLKSSSGLYLISAVFFTGFFDHYWLTLQQNFLLLGVIFALEFL